ncbi:MAG: hypothetical protein JSS83_14830 [Cyanobacteria bacterium SZAS LIN-3]|nr:hypothetical protein [Cyanobacteria bacterium SZAS LIN-3]
MALDDAVNRLVCTGSTADARTMASAVTFLVYLSRRVEALIDEDIRLALREIDKMKQLPDEAQWEYRSAYTLGVAEGLNRVATVQARIIEQAQSCLHKASILLMAARGTAMPALNNPVDAGKTVSHFNSSREYVQAILQELDPQQGRRSATANRLALELSRAYLKRTRAALESTDLTMASTCLQALEFTEANILASLSAFALEAVEFGQFLDDPARGAVTAEFKTARLMAAGIVSVCVTELLRQHAPWVTVNLN